MATPKLPSADRYVYVLFREDGITPFYVGKGRDKRWLIHERDAYRGTSRKDRIIQSMFRSGIIDVPKVKVAENLTDEQAGVIEVFLIAAFGRLPHGLLANHTRGGDGVGSLSEEAREKKSARNRISWADPKVRRRRSEGIQRANAAKGKKAAQPKALLSKEEAQARRSTGLRARWAKPGMKEAAAEKMRRFRHTDDTRAAMRDRALKLWNDPGFRKATTERIRKATQAPDVRAKHKARFSRPEERAKFAAMARTPESRAKQVAALRKSAQTPEAKAVRSAASKKMWAERKEQILVARAVRKRS